MVCKNLFYFNTIYEIGGIETFLYTIAKKYSDDFDITVVYKSCHPKQLKRLSKLVRTYKFNGDRIRCEKAFFNYNADIINSVDAKEYYMCIHGDYEALNIRPLPIYPQVDHYVGVSKLACDKFTKVSGKETMLMYNPILVPEPKKILHLISATRLSKEKGKGRMIQLGEALDKANIPYIWTVYTTDKKAINNDNIIYRTPRLDITDFIADSDYLVQLSDTEGYSYTVLEALSVSTPVIITDMPVCKEMGVIDRVNSFILPFDMSDIPIDEIYAGLPPFKFKAKEDRWNKLLVPGKSKYKAEAANMKSVVSIKPYFDMEQNEYIQAGQVLNVFPSRAETLIQAGVCKYKEG